MAQLQTPVGTLSYPHLFKPHAMPGSEDKKFSAVLLLPASALKTPAWKAIEKAVQDMARQEFPKLILGKSCRSPFRRVDEKPDAFPQEGYEVFIGASSTQKPGVVDVQRQDIVDSGDVWAGQHARLMINPFAYDKQGNKGVSFGLNHIQIVRSTGLKRLDGRKSAQESFDDEFDDAEDEV